MRKLLFVALVFGVVVGCVANSGCREKDSAHAASTIVYITRTGECYHLADCIHLRKSKTPETLEWVIDESEYRPCSRCKPPTDYSPDVPPDDSRKPELPPLQ